jgi:simple sugar transport system permease protein
MATRTQGKDERLARVSPVTRFLQQPEVGAVIGAAAIWLFFAILPASSANWISLRGLAQTLDPASTWGIMSIAVALLMIGGEFDLSTGVMTGTTGIIAGMLATGLGWNLWAGMAVALVFAIGIGLFNGYMVIKTGLPSFIVTLGTFFILRGANAGLTLLITHQVYVGGIDLTSGFGAAQTFFNTTVKFFGVTWRTPIVWWFVIAVIAHWVLLRTKYGSWIFAAGGDVNAARNLGVPAQRVKVSLFVLTAVCAWLVGMMSIARLRSAAAAQGVGQEFYYIIGATVGGCLLTGGYGSVIGASIGAFILGMANTGIPFAGLPTDWYYSFLGLMLLFAVLLNTFTRRRASEMSVAAAKIRTEEEPAREVVDG